MRLNKRLAGINLDLELTQESKKFIDSRLIYTGAGIVLLMIIKNYGKKSK